MATRIKTYDRDSNTELLRLICMVFIVLHHFMIRCIVPETFDASALLMDARIGSLFLNGFVSVGVNCFVLISGYYLIRLKWRSFLKLYLTCMFYGLIGYAVYVLVDGGRFGGGVLWNSVFIFSHSGWWFINCYVGLMLLAPILNVCVEHVEKRAFQIILLCLTVANIYFGYFWQTDAFNNTGYTIAQFAYMYMMGAYIKRYVDVDHIRKYRYASLGIYVFCAVAWAILAIVNIKHPFGYIDYVYNNPFVIVGAVAFFLFMQSFHFSSKWVNWLSAGALAAYLIQDHPLLRIHTYSDVRTLMETSNISIPTQFVLCIGMSVAFVVICCMIDKIREGIVNIILKIGERK